MRRHAWSSLVGTAAALGVILSPVTAVAASASSVSSVSSLLSVAPGCEQMWGSLPKSVPSSTSAPVTGVRAGEHPCVDRLVVDIAGAAAGYDVRYVDAVTTDGSGEPVPLRGGAKLRIVVHAPAYDQDGNPTYRPANRRELVDVSGFDTFRQIAYAGSFEGDTTIGLGVRARLPFTVSVLPGPGSSSRVVLDVAHAW
jgi:hypothetical protein